MKCCKIIQLFIWAITGYVFFFSMAPHLAAQTASPSAKTTPQPTRIMPPEAPEVGINLSVSPVFLNLITDPGQQVTSQIKVTNNNNIREYLRVDLMRFETDTSGERPIIMDVENGDVFKQWITFSPQEFIVDPNETKTVRFSVTPSQEAALGYYYALVINRIEEKSATQREAVIAGSPAISLLLEVRSPYAKRELQLVDFKTDQLFYEYLPARFDITIKNTGNIHSIPFGDIFIDWGREEDVAILKANQTRGNILPQTQRHYYAEWNDGFAVRVPKDTKGSDDKVQYETKWDFEKVHKFRIGKYTAHLLMVYDNGQRDVPVEATVSFWVIPWKIIGIAILIVLFTMLGLKNTFAGIIKSARRVRRRS